MTSIKFSGQKTTHLMLERLFELRDFIAELTIDPSLKLSNQDWIIIQDIFRKFKPARILTNILQSEQLTIGISMMCGLRVN